jgi:serine/threonine protein kinase/dienelactone hydrolase
VIGKTISHYKIIEHLGGGGMGIVYKAEDLKLKRWVAVKFLPPAFSTDPTVKERFVHEAQAASSLQHNNICAIHEIEETDDGQMFIVMDYYEGETLQKKIINERLKNKDVIEYTIQIAQGLQKAHEQGIIHRDIKPSNIIITQENEVKILDFGLAKYKGQTKLSKNGSTLGTVAYMSPEQARGEGVDQRTDIWSLGVVMYEMVTGQLPFKGDYEQAVVYSILNEEPMPPKSLLKKVSAELEKIMLRALIKDKEKRYDSVNDIYKDLIKYQSKFILRSPDQINSKQILRQIVRPKIVIPIILFLVILSSVLFWLIKKKTKIQWAKEIGVPKISQLVEERNFFSAFHMAQKVVKYIPGDSTLIKLWPKMSRYISIQTIPSGADVNFKEYNAVESKWEYLGKTPIDRLRIPRGFFRWKIEKDEFVIIEDAFAGSEDKYQFTLDKVGDIAIDMVRVPGRKHSVLLMGHGYLDIQLNDYLIDKYEVTNSQYKKFVESGGYQNPEFWKYKFIKERKEVSWKEAMAEFRDATGRPGPATWELGSYPEGQDDYPVNGVSWYEATAYAEFVGKKLPTYYHWRIAAATDYSEYIIPLSNFGKRGLAPVGSNSGLNHFGTYDMAGNVREWCFNSTAEKRFILGGAWDDPYYMFYLRDAKSPFDRSPGNGFRCVKYLSPQSTSEIAERPISISVRNYSKEKPVSEKTFKVFASLYSYDRTDLNPKIEFVDENSKYWRKEKISYNTAYSSERMSSYLFLPKNTHPPYQTVIIFPGAGVFRRRSSENGDNLHSWYAVDFVIKSGRAVLYPVYKSTYERYDDYKYWQSNIQMSAFRDRVIIWLKDLSRSIDYLETRSDIDPEKLCFAGSSWGAMIAPNFLAMESRFKVCYLFIGGFLLHEALPEVDPINFISRVKIPVLMLNGRYDSFFPYETLQLPMYRLFGAPNEHKRHKLFNVGHTIPKPKNEYVREVLDWLDKHLGAVN